VATFGTMAATARRLEKMERRIFEDCEDDLAEDDDVRRVLGLPPSSQRRRLESEVSAYTSATPSSSLNFPTHDPASLPSEPLVHAQMTLPMPTSAAHPNLEPSQGLSKAELVAMQRYGQWLDEDVTIPQRGDNVLDGSLQWAGPVNQSQVASTDASAYTQTIPLPQTATEQGLQNLQGLGGHEGPAPHQPGNLQLSSTNEGLARQRSSSEQSATQQQRKNVPQAITGFPSHRAELPAGISLENICRLYPNHLFGPHLRLFIRENWSAQMMWDAMDDRAKSTGAVKRPWNKLEHRIRKVKKLMAAEQKEARQRTMLARLTQQSPDASVQAGISLNTAGTIHQRDSSGNMELEASRAQLPSLNQTAMFRTGSLQHGNIAENDTSVSVEERMAGLHEFFKVELREQGNLISIQLSHDDPRWRYQSIPEMGRSIDEEWIRRAKRLERIFASDHDIDIDSLRIEFEPNSTEGMLRRLKAMLLAYSAADTTSSESALSADEKNVQAVRAQLGVLQDWTIQWREQLDEHLGRTSGTSSGHVLSSYQQQQITQEPRLTAHANLPQSSYQGYMPVMTREGEVSGSQANQRNLHVRNAPAANAGYQIPAPAPPEEFSYEQFLKEGGGLDMSWLNDEM
jgi:hypothetical protein